ncbi:MAG: hypothetical protein CMQ16_01625 [Gammaproteobacteria bacterium]|nr:hypothetical protein [Gammaproteobacteria bacterium]
MTIPRFGRNERLQPTGQRMTAAERERSKQGRGRLAKHAQNWPSTPRSGYCQPQAVGILTSEVE